MDLQYENKQINGLPTYVYYGQNERVDELNTKINSRSFSDFQLEPNYDPRPIPTKYSIFPMINRRSIPHEPVVQYNNYNLKTNFNPGNDKGPVSGYVNNIETEHKLRNQHFALQRNCIQSTYIPSPESDLYKVQVDYKPSKQEHPLLFRKIRFEPKIHPNVENTEIGNKQFFNHTRTQLRNSSSI